MGRLLEQTSATVSTKPNESARSSYRCRLLLLSRSFCCEQEHEYNPDLTVIVGDFRRGKRIVEQELDKLRSRFDTKDIELFFTDTTNFRKEIDPSYKGNRTQAQALRIPEAEELGPGDICISHHAALEADDALGIAATSGLYDNFVLVSPDKDMQQIPAVFTT